MAKIMYGVCGEGMGHAIRSRPTIEFLKKNHEVRIFASGKAYEYLSKKFKGVIEIQGVYIQYKNNEISELGTVTYFLKNLSRLIKSFRLITSHIERFKPSVIITDFETLSCYAGLLKKIPVISIDNQHIYTNTEVYYPKRFIYSSFLSRTINRLLIPTAQNYLINTFFYAKPNTQKALLIPPVLRNEIFKLKPKDKGHILVYQTTNTNKRLLKILRLINHKFIVYGFDIEKKDKNITFHKFNEKQFFQDLANCKALIANGGFTTISEALYLKKPVLSIPVGRQFEQILNALYIDKLGYGKYKRRATVIGILKFIRNVKRYRNNLEEYHNPGTSKSLQILEFLIKKK
jgi:uncharacterized protein (TIGR00661 family)